MLLVYTQVIYAQQPAQEQQEHEVEATDVLVDPTSTPSKKILFSVYPNPQSGDIKVAMHSYIGERVTFTLVGPTRKVLQTKAVADCTDQTVVDFKLKKVKKGNYTIRVVNSRLQHMSQMFVL
jgi:hypothetical protein